MADASSSRSACRAYEVCINRWALYRVLDMPGLTRIDLQPKVAVLTFETAPGCDPTGLEFVASEVQRVSGGHALEAHERV